MTRRRFDLTDFEWRIVQPLLPNKPRGVPRVDDRRVINGILWRFRTGSPWADIPNDMDLIQPATIASCGGAKQAPGIIVMHEVAKAFDGDIVMIDSSCVRVHQHAATGKKGEQDDCCMGRSRGGLTTKIHAVVDADGRPIGLDLTPGQTHDSKMAEPMLSECYQMRAGKRRRERGAIGRSCSSVTFLASGSATIWF